MELNPSESVCHSYFQERVFCKGGEGKRSWAPYLAAQAHWEEQKRALNHLAVVGRFPLGMQGSPA